MKSNASLIIDGREVVINDERNLLEVIRKAGVELPTFCYHSNLSVYGACRLCLVQVEGRGIVGACSTPAEPGMRVRTTTEEIREIRRIAVELLLANHERSCTTCARSTNCQLQELARRLGIQKVRFKPVHESEPVDCSSPSLVRDPNKCVLCGDCVRVCSEIQSVGAIDFAYRGHEVAVLPAFGKDLKDVECVYCGQCASVCPTGALTPKSEVEQVWKELDNPKKRVIAQIAPAVRVGLGEEFGLEPGTLVTGKIVAALKAMGFDEVYDTSFTADLTVLEETEEFLARKAAGKNLPQFTSCCPGWVKFAEQYFPDLLNHVSSCKSPQQMFGALAKDLLPRKLGIEKKDLVVVSIMPCTAKKHEARLQRFTYDGIRDVDYVLTTQELARMIEEAGLRFHQLRPESLDMPFGFKTGAGVIFGNSGGVSEAVLRNAVERISGRPLEKVDFEEVRGEEGLRTASFEVNGTKLRIGVVHGLANARRVAEQVRAGDAPYDFIEVMACPGGCIGGAGQPVTRDMEAQRLRTRGLYEADKMLELHKSQENLFISQLYETELGTIGGEKAHHLLHTHYHSRRRITNLPLALTPPHDEAGQRVPVSVCVGTNCMAKGAQPLLQKLMAHVEERGLQDAVDVKASFCFEKCDRGPTVLIGGKVIHHCTIEKAREALDAATAPAMREHG